MASPSLNLEVVGAEVAKQAKKAAVTQINLLLGRDAKKLTSISEVVQLFYNTKVDMEKKVSKDSFRKIYLMLLLSKIKRDTFCIILACIPLNILVT
jgi:tRNA U54 and U55 pseudouridine synthase Pus10